VGERATRPSGDTERLQAAVIDACRADVDSGELLAELSRRMQQVVPFDSCLWFGADPDTLLASWPTRVENIEAGHCATYWGREFTVEDAILYRDLARSPQAAATLHCVTGGHPARSARWREFLAPQGYDDELRAAARAGSATWGFISLIRAKGRPSFSPQDTALVASVSHAVGEALRSRWLREMSPGPAPVAPGLLMVDRTGAVVSLNDEAQAWLEHLPDATSPDGLTHSTGVWNVVAKAWATANGNEPGTARVRLRSRSGQWLILHASTLKGASATAELTAVMIEPAQAGEIAPIIVRAYALTPRELDITQALARGLTTSEIAATLFLSAHTVRDHIKSIFEKVSVNSRGELVAQLFAEHYAPAHLRTAQQLEI
jgi:DNA-binding CsgD family transcriptional regulator